jgi:hypothetical protein
MPAACPTCRLPLVASPSGFVCERGCTRILSAEQVKALENAQLPRATLLAVFEVHRYTIAGQQGIWESCYKAEGELRAFTGKRATWFRRCPELERRIIDALGDQLAEAALSR